MLIVGAKGHAIEVLDIFEKNMYLEELFFFDNVSKDLKSKLYGKYSIIRSFQQLEQLNHVNKNFVLGCGNRVVRYNLSKKFISLGWKLTSIISNTLKIGNNNVVLEDGLNIMLNVIITNDIRIGEGSLINAGVLIHHNARIGKYCEISPGVCITGNVEIKDFTFIGSCAVIIPNVTIGKNCVIGAGSVVNQDIPDNSVAVGVPAKIIKETEPFNE